MEKSDLDVAGNEQLTNADFRKFLTTPRAEESATSSGASSSKEASTRRGFAVPRDYNTSNESVAEQRRKRKSFYAKLQKQEMERQAELSAKYRDRSKERREGKGDYADVELVSTTADYRAVGPNAELDKTSAEKRRQVIQESKFLGGDMAHTHLVKGLDFALLQKVRAEISTKEKDDEMLDMLLEQQDGAEAENIKKDNLLENIRNKTAKNVCRLLFERKRPFRNESFLPGRMAYVFNLDDEEVVESDIPTILMRSKADCPHVEQQSTPSTHEIVVNKLQQIMSLIRQGSKDKRRKRDRKMRTIEEKSKSVAHASNISIFDDVGSYKPSTKKSKPNKLGVGPYFEKKAKLEDLNPDKLKAEANASIKQVIKNISDKSKAATKATNKAAKSKGGKPLLGMGATAPDSYAECYPSTQFQISNAAEESDEEADYSKMDQGNKKGPVGRWDFDTNEEYSSYMSKKEATPKAAFQYGIKMSGGRKTRRSRDQKIDRELQQIQKIMSKRTDDDTFKKPKY